MVGTDARSKVGLLNALFRTPLHRRTEAESEKAAAELLEFVGVSGSADAVDPDFFLAFGDFQLGNARFLHQVDQFLEFSKVHFRKSYFVGS